MKHGRAHELIREALRDAPVALSDGAIDQLARHWELVKTWNARVNLTSILDDEEAAWRHYRDSLEALPLLPPGSIVDLGSGAGFPGVPLAVAAPDRDFTLVEPRRKRVSFLEVALARAGIPNARVLCASSADGPDRPYAAAVTRATFPSAEEIADCLRWVVPGGRVIAYRSEPSGLAGTTLHPYRLRDLDRLLEVWTRPDSAT